MSEDERTARLERRNLVQLEAAFEELQENLNQQIGLLTDSFLDHSAEIDRITGNMTDGQRTRGANVPLVPFYGNRNEDFAQYLKQFELICDANNYATDKRAQILASYLRDKAFYTYDSLTDVQKADYNQLKVALGEKFQTTDYRRYAHQKFQERKQRTTETVADYGCDVHRLGLAALAAIASDQRDTLIREKFIAGLLPQLKELIIYSSPRSFNEAMTLAERLEGLQAGKQDASTKSVMLLEEISGRLAKLECGETTTEANRNTHNSTYLIEKSRFNAGLTSPPQTGFNLNNDRPDIRPNGMVCYRCNRTGHIARNCPRNRDMNTVTCRICNRMGHFARNCQRRGITFGRRPIRPNFNQGPHIRIGRYNFPPPKGLPNRSMAVSVPGQQNENTNSEEIRWQPLVGALQFRKREHARSLNGLPEQTENGNTGTDKRCAKPWNYCKVDLRIAIKFLLLLILPTILWSKGTASQSSSATWSSPMICQAYEGKALWKLPVTFNCPKGNHTAETEVKQVAMLLYKRNYVQYKTKAWKCVRITQEIETFSYFFGDENLKREHKKTEAVSAEECTTMKNYKTCGGQPMIYHAGIYQTNNKMEWYYPGGGVNCCHWKKFSVSNCYMYETHAYKRHDNPVMESTAGDVSNCIYERGQCVLADGAFLLWEVSNTSKCDILPWKTMPGKRYGTSWLSDDSNLALTFTSNSQTMDCYRNPLLMSDQGIPVRPLPQGNKTRKVRQLTNQQIARIGKLLKSSGGMVSSSQLAASLQALEIRWKQNMEFGFSHALNSVCNFMRSIVELLKTQVLANPTMAIRSLTNQSDIFAKSGGNVLEVFPCTQLHRNAYQFKPMNGTCTAQLPIKFQINNKTNLGYLDPTTNIIHRFAMPMDCRMVKEVPLQIEDKTYLYSSRTGHLAPAHRIPTLKVLQWNVEPIIDMKATIFHEIVIYNWNELQTHISLNDIMGGLDRQRAVLQQMGISTEEGEPSKNAERAVSQIMGMGYFGFLHGLTANLFQIWTFLVCLYVTVCVVIIHCVPITSIPAGLNLGNAVCKLKGVISSWNRQREQDQENQEPTGSRVLRMFRPRSNDASDFEKRIEEARERLGRRPLLQLLPPPQSALMAPTAPVWGDEVRPNKRRRRHEDDTELPAITESVVTPFRVNFVGHVDRLWNVRVGEGARFLIRFFEQGRDWIFNKIESMVQNCQAESHRIDESDGRCFLTSRQGQPADETDCKADDTDSRFRRLKTGVEQTLLDVPANQFVLGFRTVSPNANSQRQRQQKQRSNEQIVMANANKETKNGIEPKTELISSFQGSSEMVITADLEGIRVQTLIDTGSSLTIIPKHIAELLRNELSHENIQAVSMTGHSLHVIGEIQTMLRIGNRDVQGKIVVVKESPYELIVGTDLMKYFGKVTFDFARKITSFGTEEIPMTERRGTVGVFLCQEVVIPPKTSIIVMGLCFGFTPNQLWESAMVIFEPAEKLVNKYDVTSQEAIVQPSDKLVPVKLTNVDLITKYLPERATLGCLYPLDQHEVNQIGLQGSGENLVVKLGRPRDAKELHEFLNGIVLNEQLHESQKQELSQLLLRYEALFAKNDYDLGVTTLTEHKIETGDARAIRQRPYRTPHSLRPYMSRKIEEMLQHGIIQPSDSDWSSPVVLVKKQDSKELRFCVDNRKLNDVTVKDSYPLKRIDDAFDMLGGSQYFATLDLQSGYWQIPIRKTDQKKTAFVTGDGLYEYTKMNFGLCNAPATFQRLMDQVLRGLDLKICMSYIDDIIVPASDTVQLAQRLEVVFKRLLRAGLKLKLKKCKFGMTELKFLGFIVSKDGLKADPDKITKITAADAPKNLEELRTFLGFAGWCKRFIRNYAQIAEPLTNLLKQSKAYKWTSDAQSAFERLKTMYTEAPILTYPDMNQPFIICTDASNKAIGAILCQKDTENREQPISYDGRVLNKCERNYSTVEREMLAIFWAVVKKYRVYVFGRDFTVFTDHKPLLGVWKSPPNDGRLGRWCVRMQEYRPHMSLQYREGKKNVAADYLSRQPVDEKMNMTGLVLATVPEDISIREEQRKDSFIGSLIQYLEEGKLPEEKRTADKIRRWSASYAIIDGILHKETNKRQKWLVVLPRTLRKSVMTAYHDSLLGGHLGIRKTLSKIEGKYFWPNYYKDVVEWCRGCLACQSRKPPPRHTKAPLKPIPVTRINQKWAWDICGPLPQSQNGNRYILVCMEYFSKFPEAFAIPDTKTERLAKIFVENIVLRYGCPDILISDQGLNVHSGLVKQICEMLDVKKIRTTAYHPQSDGMVERFNRTLQQMISMYINKGHTDWCEFLPFLTFAYRASVHESSKETPFFLMYGFDPRLPVDLSFMPENHGYLTTDDDYKLYILASLLESRRLVSKNIAIAQERQKTQYDRKSRPHAFMEGDRVMVHYPVIGKGKTKKFTRAWKGQYRIVEISANGTNIRVEPIGGRRPPAPLWIHVNRAKLTNPEPALWHTATDEQESGDSQDAELSADRNDGQDIQAQEEASSDECRAVSPEGTNEAVTRRLRSPEKENGPTRNQNASSNGPKFHKKDTCAICGKRGKPGKWIACDKCLKWFHFNCVDLQTDPEEDEWFCPKCISGTEVKEKESYEEASDDWEGSDSSIATMSDAEEGAEQQHQAMCMSVGINKVDSNWDLPQQTTALTCCMISVRNKEELSNWYDLRIPTNRDLPVKYSIGRQFANGGFGRIYAGTRVSDDLPVAIKSIPYCRIHQWRSLDGRDVPLELEILKRCQDVPGVVEVLDWGYWPDSFYIVMERPSLDGDLFDYVTKHQRLTEGMARFYFSQIVTTVKGIHDKGIVHRDLKDENLLINALQDEIILIDFGAAEYRDREPFREYPGTPIYSPPEWILEEKYFSESADVWSLGLILHTLVCGDIPFHTDEDILRNKLRFSKQLSSECQDLIRWCLATRAEERPSLSQLSRHVWFTGQESRYTRAPLLVLSPTQQPQEVAAEWKNKIHNPNRTLPDCMANSYETVRKWIMESPFGKYLPVNNSGEQRARSPQVIETDDTIDKGDICVEFQEGEHGIDSAQGTDMHQNGGCDSWAEHEMGDLPPVSMSYSQCPWIKNGISNSPPNPSTWTMHTSQMLG